MAGRDGGVGRRGGEAGAGSRRRMCRRLVRTITGDVRGLPARRDAGPGDDPDPELHGIQEGGAPKGRGFWEEERGFWGSGERALGKGSGKYCPPRMSARPVSDVASGRVPEAVCAAESPRAGCGSGAVRPRSEVGARWSGAVRRGPARSGAVRRGPTWDDRGCDTGATRVRHGCDTGATQFGAVQRAGAVRRGCDAVRRWSDVGATRSGARCDLGRHLDVGRPRHRWRRFQGAGAMVSRPERRRERCVR